MRVTISARHGALTDPLRERAETIVARLGQLTPFGQEAPVLFDGLQRPAAEVRLRLSGGRLFVARGAAADHRSALDRAEARMRRQLERPPARAGGRRRASRA